MEEEIKVSREGIISKINTLLPPRRIYPNWKTLLIPFIQMTIGGMIASICFLQWLINNNIAFAIIGFPVLFIAIIYPIFRFLKQMVVFRSGFALSGKITEVYSDVSLNKKPYYQLVAEFKYLNIDYKVKFSMMKNSDFGETILIVMANNPKIAEIYSGKDIWKITDL